MSDEQSFELSLEQVEDFEFRVRFDGTVIKDLATDEPPPQGHDAGPDPARLLLAAVANCLAASLLFSLRKFRMRPVHCARRRVRAGVPMSVSVRDGQGQVVHATARNSDDTRGSDGSRLHAH